MKLTAVLLFSLTLVFTGVHLVSTGSAREVQKPIKAQEDATPIEAGVMSEKQKQHSKLYRHYGTGKNLLDLAKTEEGEIEIHKTPPISGGIPDAPELSLNEVLKQHACAADGIVVGTVKSKASQITEEGNFIFTDYELVVEDVVKANNTTPIYLNSEITVTRPGGAVLFSGKKIRAEDALFQPLQVGKHYLLFLKFIPITGAYQSINSGGTFRLIGNKVQEYSAASRKELEVKYDVTSFITEVRIAAAVPCNTKGGAH